MDREYGLVQEGSANDGAPRRRPESRFLRLHPLGRWANDFARSAAAGRSQCVSPGTTGDAAEKHRKMNERITAETQRNSRGKFFKNQKRFSRRSLRLGGEHNLSRTNWRAHRPLPENNSYPLAPALVNTQHFPIDLR